MMIIETEDYKVLNSADRIKVVEKRLAAKESEIMDRLTRKTYITETSEHLSICKDLEKVADYILYSDDIKLENAKKNATYRFYRDETEFKERTKKEDSLKGMCDSAAAKIESGESNDENVISFLLRSQSNHKISKELKLNPLDSRIGGYAGQILSEYQEYVNFLDNIMKDIKENPNSKYKGQRYRITHIKSGIKYDMLYCKKHLLGIFGEKLKNPLVEGEVPNWDKFDWWEISHIKELFNLLKEDFEIEIGDDLSHLVFDMDNLVEEMLNKGCFTKNEKKIISLSKLQYKNSEIALEMNSTRAYISQSLKVIFKKIAEHTLENWKIEN